MGSLARVTQWNSFARMWHLYDAKWQNPVESAQIIKKYLQGLHKPIYHPLSDCGDHVVVINSRDIALPGNEWRTRVFFHHTGYPGGASWTLAYELHDKDPTMIMKKVVYNSMKGNLQRRYTMQRLHIFPDSNVPKDVLENISNQIRQLRPPPKPLQDYNKEQIDSFPKIVDYPKDYVIR